jgi:hypothetical protein
LRLATVFTLVSVLHVARAADVSGTWKGAFEFQGSSIALTINLKSDGGKLTGEVEGLPTTPTEIHDAAVAGDILTFWVNSDYEGETYKLVYKGKIAADEIVFDFGTEDGSWSSPLTVKKDVSAAPPTPAAAPVSPAPATPAVPAGAPAPAAGPVDVSGDWKGSFDLNGSSVPVTFHLKNFGPTVRGTIDGLGPSPTELHEGEVDGDSLTFWVNTDYEGQTYTLTYNGKLSGSQIAFQFGTADGSWSSSVTAAKVQ